eukprot:3545277-Amphidinium_carterae.1
MRRLAAGEMTLVPTQANSGGISLQHQFYFMIWGCSHLVPGGDQRSPTVPTITPLLQILQSGGARYPLDEDDDLSPVRMTCHVLVQNEENGFM